MRWGLNDLNATKNPCLLERRSHLKSFSCVRNVGSYTLQKILRHTKHMYGGIVLCTVPCRTGCNATPPIPSYARHTSGILVTSGSPSHWVVPLILVSQGQTSLGRSDSVLPHHIVYCIMLIMSRNRYNFYCGDPPAKIRRGD